MTLTQSIEDALFNDIEASVKNGTIIDWIHDNRSVKGKPWAWVTTDTTRFGRTLTKDFRYLIPIYLDDHPTIIIKKSRQMAISEYAVNWITYLTSTIPHCTALHVFPNQDQAKKFSMVRLTPVFDRKQSPKLARLLKNPDERYTTSLQAAMNVYHKQFTNLSNYILSFIGGINAKSTDARSVSADIVFLDESKDLPQEKITDVIECMALSDLRMLRMAGTPDFEGTEFDRRFESSDKREWIVTCQHCGAAQQITFSDSIMPISASPLLLVRESKYYYGCADCKHELDRSADHGKWVAQNPSASAHGYHVTQLMSSWISADEIMQKKSDNIKYPQKFANEVLGETYAGGSKPITFSKLLNGKVDEGTIGSSFRNVTIGVDWGNQSHYVVLGANSHSKKFILDQGIWEDPIGIKHAHKLAELINLWKPGLVVMDSGYGRNQNQEIFKAFPGQAYACFYKDTSFLPVWSRIDTLDGEYLATPDIQYHVSANHTSLCDTVMADIDEGRLKIPVGDDDELLHGVSTIRDYMDNMCLARVAFVENQGTKRRKWVITKAHYFAATAYATLALNHLMGEFEEEGEGASGFFIPKGYR